jgi:hypothetical protein
MEDIHKIKLSNKLMDLTQIPQRHNFFVCYNDTGGKPKRKIN